MDERKIKMAYEAAVKDLGRYYFIAFSIKKDSNVYTEIYISPNEDAFLLLRKSGTVQVMSVGECVSPQSGKWITETLANMQWKTVICLRMHLEFIYGIETDFKLRKGGYISKCTPEQWQVSSTSFEPVEQETKQVESVIHLYEKVFTGFASQNYILNKLTNKDGRGYLILEDEKCMAVAQSDFEYLNAALIVGVASDETVRGLGYGKACMVALGNALCQEEKTMFLIYDNPIAGSLYKKLGFVDYDRLYHVEKE